jgi:hypothetical protein
MALDLSGGATAYATMIDNFAKSIIRTPVTKTISNVSGNETLTEGTAVTISGTLYRKEDMWAQDKAGLFQGADAIVMVKPDVTINKDDKLTYDGEDYRVEKVITRRLGTTSFYQTVWCFKT